MKKNILPLEIFFSIIIIFSIVFIVTIVCLEIRLYSQKINKEAEASRIASNIIENIKMRSYEDVEKYIEELSYVGITKKIENNIQYVTIDGKEFSENFFGTQIPKDYTVDFQTEIYGEGFNIQKRIDLTLIYNLNQKIEDFSVSTVIDRENINECNSPIISDEYFKDLGVSEDRFEIIPIKYSEEKSSYVTTTKDDFEWFNYSAKLWAKVLIFEKENNLKEIFVNEDGTINKTVKTEKNTLNMEEYLYVWIPNFSIKDDETFFRYKASKKAIKMDFNYVDGKYLYLYKIGEEVKDISEECNFEGIYGIWKKLDDENDIYYKYFNQTKYAPQKLD